MDRVDDGFDGKDVLARDFREVRALREPPPDDAVDVLDRAFLVRGVGSRVVDGASEDSFEGFLARDLAAVVRGGGLEVFVDGAAPLHSAERARGSPWRRTGSASVRRSVSAGGWPSARSCAFPRPCWPCRRPPSTALAPQNTPDSATCRPS